MRGARVRCDRLGLGRMLCQAGLTSLVSWSSARTCLPELPTHWTFSTRHGLVHIPKSVFNGPGWFLNLDEAQVNDYLFTNRNFHPGPRDPFLRQEAMSAHCQFLGPTSTAESNTQVLRR